MLNNKTFSSLAYLLHVAVQPLPSRLIKYSKEISRMTVTREIPRHLQEDYRLLQLQVEDSPAQVRAQYRELAKRYHPDAGGYHADFLALQQAYERVVQYQQTCK
jgi:DnaJ-class molecular chaperone